MAEPAIKRQRPQKKAVTKKAVKNTVAKKALNKAVATKEERRSSHRDTLDR